MSNRRKDQSEQRTVDWSKIVHPSLRDSDQGVKDREIKPRTLSSGCINRLKPRRNIRYWLSLSLLKAF